MAGIAYAPKCRALQWCVKPQLDLPHFWPKAVARPNLAQALKSPPKLNGAEVEGGLVLWGTENQRRVFSALADLATYRPLTVVARRSDWARVLLDPLSRRRLHRSGHAFLQGEGLAGLSSVWEGILEHTAYMLRAARRMQLDQYRFVAVASQHAPYLRAFLWEAARLGVPTLYVPHAPAGDNAQYLDLPTSAVGLRGTAEVELYSLVLGVAPDEMDIVGNPASDVLGFEEPKISDGSPGVLALSPQPTEVLQQLIEMVVASGLTNLRVAPHPRSDLDTLRAMLPTTWRLEEGRRTLDLLREGPSFLLQHSSGVAWEAIALGIPTAELSLDDSPPHYFFLQDESIFPSVDDGKSVAAFAQSATATPSSRRHQLRDYARAWCSFDGCESREALIRLLSTAEEWPSSMVYDGWGSGPNVTTRASRLL